MENLLRETFRGLNRARKAGISPASIRSVMGSREAVFRLARRIPGAVRKGGLPLDVLATELGVVDGATLFYQLIGCPRRSDLIANFTREMDEFCGSSGQMESFFEAAWPEPQLTACPF